jgi:serine/threonine protein kinase
VKRASGSSISEFPLPAFALRRGDLIADKYRLARPIGEGAMGSVWVAKNEVLDVDIAIKFMRTDTPRSDPQNLYKRLLQEARAAARLGHPAIVRVFDFGRTGDGTPFIVMELLKGEPLSSLLQREGRLEVTRALQMMLPIADALATAHDRGIVHRDIKPENIFIASDEYGRLQPKLVDFGIARLSEGTGTLTRSGALLGTPDYMSPEQARGEPDVDHRVDVWALCVVLYELMAGRRPFGQEGSNYLAVLRAIVHDNVRPFLDYEVGDKALWVIIERGLRKRPQERWDTMRVLGEALALWLYERGIREDAFGASLKTGWLQAGFDGVKIDTTSMFPANSVEVAQVIGELDELLSPPSSVPAFSAPARAPSEAQEGEDGSVRATPVRSAPARRAPVELDSEMASEATLPRVSREALLAASTAHSTRQRRLLLPVVVVAGLILVAVAALALRPAALSADKEGAGAAGTRVVTQAFAPTSAPAEHEEMGVGARPRALQPAVEVAGTEQPEAAAPTAQGAEPEPPPEPAVAVARPAVRPKASKPRQKPASKPSTSAGSFDLGF